MQQNVELERYTEPIGKVGSLKGALSRLTGFPEQKNVTTDTRTDVDCYESISKEKLNDGHVLFVVEMSNMHRIRSMCSHCIFTILPVKNSPSSTHMPNTLNFGLAQSESQDIATARVVKSSLIERENINNHPLN